MCKEERHRGEGAREGDDDGGTQPGHDRRRFLKATGAATMFGIVGGALPAGAANAAALTKAQRDAMTPERVLQKMQAGNKRFASGVRKNRNYLDEQKASAKGQYPAAVVLSCIDSRAPAEVIMDFGLGDIFNSRVAGNIQNGDILGGMEFACKLSGAKVILVMGHTKCGAVKGAIANAELGNLTGLLAKIKPAVQATTYAGDRSAENYGFVDAVARRNVELTVEEIRRNSPVLAEMEKNGEIRIVGAMYDISTGRVEFLA
jgi:carbonic anhydrase